MRGWYTPHVVAWCAYGPCDWGVRVEDPTPTDIARVLRQARSHAHIPGHDVCVERGGSQSFAAPALTGPQAPT